MLGILYKWNNNRSKLLEFRSDPFRGRKTARNSVPWTKIETNTCNFVPNHSAERKQLGIPICGRKIGANSRNSVPKHFDDANTLSILFAGAGFWVYSTEFFWNEIPLSTLASSLSQKLPYPPHFAKEGHPNGAAIMIVLHEEGKGWESLYERREKGWSPIYSGATMQANKRPQFLACTKFGSTKRGFCFQNFHHIFLFFSLVTVQYFFLSNYT
jgi:hypothetical protein